MAPKRVKNKRKKPVRAKLTKKKSEDLQSDSDDNLLVDIDDLEKYINLHPTCLQILESIKPQLEEVDKVINVHLKNQKHKFDSTFSGRLAQKERKVGLFQISDENFTTTLRDLLKHSQEETLIIRNALTALNTIRTKRYFMLSGREIGDHLKFDDFIREIGRSIPLWVGLTNEIAPSLCGAIPPPDDFEFKPGHLVAAHVVSDDVEQEVHADYGIIGKWILTVVMELKDRLYAVKDMDGSDTVYCVPKKKMIPLPLYMADPKTNPEAIYPRNSLVLALYTGTTCFFPGVVIKTPTTVSKDYEVRFRDITNAFGWGAKLEVEQQFVIPYKDVYSVVDEEERKHLIELYGPIAVMPIKKTS